MDEIDKLLNEVEGEVLLKVWGGKAMPNVYINRLIIKVMYITLSIYTEKIIELKKRIRDENTDKVY